MNNGVICDIDLFGMTNFYIFKGEEKELITKSLSSISDICYVLENLLLSSNSNYIHLFGLEQHAEAIVETLHTRNMFSNLIIEVN